jgi:hypothetical protein
LAKRRAIILLNTLAELETVDVYQRPTAIFC